jgi:DNA-binding MarR family transcriptional regulator
MEPHVANRRPPAVELDDALQRHSAGASPGFLLWHASLRWQRVVTAALQEFGLTHVQFLVLGSCWWLSKTTGVPSQRDIAVHAGLDEVMTSQVVRALERDQLLRRDRDRDDARVLRVQITSSGRSLAARSVVRLDEVDADFFGSVTPLAGLLDALRLLGARGPSGEALG